MSTSGPQHHPRRILSGGFTLAVIQLVALSGSFLAYRIGDRFGSKWPIVLGVGINVAAAVAINYSTRPISASRSLVMICSAVCRFLPTRLPHSRDPTVTYVLGFYTLLRATYTLYWVPL